MGYARGYRGEGHDAYDHTADMSNAHTVSVAGITLCFSYRTIVAFAIPGYGWVVSENVWGSHTGRHMNTMLPGSVASLPHDEFLKRLDMLTHTINGSAIDRLSTDLRNLDRFGTPANLAGAGIARVEEFIS